MIVISGGTDGMGRALALARAERGGTVIVLGSNPDKGRRLLAEADQVGAAGRIDVVQVALLRCEVSGRGSPAEAGVGSLRRVR